MPVYTAPKSILAHPGVESCTPVSGGFYRHHVRLRPGWNFSQGGLDRQTEGRFETAADFRYAYAVERVLLSEAEEAQLWRDCVRAMFDLDNPEGFAPERPAHLPRLVSRAPAGWTYAPGSEVLHGFSSEQPDEVAARLAVTPCTCPDCKGVPPIGGPLRR